MKNMKNMKSMLYAIKPSTFKELLLDTENNRNLKLNWTMFYISNEIKNYIHVAYYLCKFLKNKTYLTRSANIQIDTYLRDYKDLAYAIKTDNENFAYLLISKLHESSKNFINTYFIEIKFPETNSLTIENTKVEQLNLENLFTKYYDYNRIVNVDYDSTKLKKYALYEIETPMSVICKKA